MSVAPQTVFDDILDLALAREEARRPTLVRVLTDGFVRDQGPRSAAEIRQYGELMLNLLPAVDSFTRAVVAQKLASRRDAPQAVIEALAFDEDAVAEPILTHSPLLSPASIDRLIAEGAQGQRAALARRGDLDTRQVERLIASGEPEAAARLGVVGPARTPIEPRHEVPRREPARSAAPAPAPAPAPARPAAPTRADVPARPAPSFLDAPPATRRAILEKLVEANIPLTVGAPAPEAIKALVRHAVLRQREPFAQALAAPLGVPPALARRIAEDAHGEPLVIAGKVLGLSEDVTAQLLGYVNPALGASVEAILELRGLYRTLTVSAAATVVATWRADPRRPGHRPFQAPARPGVPDAAPAARTERTASATGTEGR